MHSLFAIEPSSISCWQDFRYVIEKFGFNKGLLIARYPSSWARMVLEECKDKVSETDYLRIVEKLSEAKQDKLFKQRVTYQPDENWIDNVSKGEVLCHMDAVLVDSEVDDALFYDVSSVPEDLFENRREKEVQRNAVELANASRFLVADASVLYFIDPYFQPKSKCLKVLHAIITEARIKGRRLNKVVVFSSCSVDPRTSEDLKTDYISSLQQWLDCGISFYFYRLDDDKLDQDFHARYLLTDIAGLRFDRGFVEPESHEQRLHVTDVACLEPATVGSLKEKYCHNETLLRETDCIELSQ
jgi:hypothetical protein